METGYPIPNYRLWLANEYASRTHKNPSYSLRAFSKKLGVSPATLSQILSGKRPLARKTAMKIIDRCGMAPEDAKNFLASASGIEVKADDKYLESHFTSLDLEAFRVISDWYHYAILSLGDIPSNRHSDKWIAARLSISPKEAHQAFLRLERLGLVERRGLGFIQAGKSLTMPTLNGNHALRKAHLQNLRKAETHLENGTAPMELFSSMTMAVDEMNLESARGIIREFRRKLCQTLEQGKKHRVYTLAVQLFPVSHPEGTLK